MPSSLIFVALAAAWLVVLVPMVAKRRQEVVRTADSALASRVLQRPVPRLVLDHGEERLIMTQAYDPEPETPDVPDQRGRRAYRPGRGGYDPEAAELAASARYALRQRIVIVLALGAAVTLVAAVLTAGVMWAAHLGLDLVLLGYLSYLRRQVRIEEDVRRRRAERFEKVHGPIQPAARGDLEEVEELDEVSEYEDFRDFNDFGEVAEVPEAEPAPMPVRARSQVSVRPGASAVELDDEDPVFDDLRPRFEPPYRRAVGE